MDGKGNTDPTIGYTQRQVRKFNFLCETYVKSIGFDVPKIFVNIAMIKLTFEAIFFENGCLYRILCLF